MINSQKHATPVTFWAYSILILMLCALMFMISLPAFAKTNDSLSVSGQTTSLSLNNPDCFSILTPCNYTIAGVFSGQPQPGTFEGTYTFYPASAQYISQNTVCFDYIGSITATFALPKNAKATFDLSGVNCMTEGQDSQTINGVFVVSNGTKKYTKLNDSGVVSGTVSAEGVIQFSLN